MSFKEYYQHYLTLHQNKWNRRLHAAGQISTLVFVGFCLASQHWLPLILTPFIVYPFAWSGHLFFEKNKPAAWSSPLWAKACDWVMLKDMLIRKI
jgi:hypothetical protein|tara:strand:- start:1002 stop:1286 length:285 start_codon:yes stop_codon:yes gene_type:complete